MITEADLGQTRMSISYTFAPLRNIICDLSGLIGRSVRELIDAFYPPVAGQRVEVLIAELVDNIVQNIVDPESEMSLDLSVEDGTLHVRTRNVARRESFEKVRDHVAAIRAARDAGTLQDLMRQTIRERRKARLTGGLGFIRLVHESRFDLAVEHDDGELVIDAWLDMNALADEKGDAR